MAGELEERGERQGWGVDDALRDAGRSPYWRSRWYWRFQTGVVVALGFGFVVFLLVMLVIWWWQAQ